VAGRRGITRKQLLDDIKETRGYWILKEIAHCGKLTLEVVMDLL
jgi:predicted DNA-binding ribbon-helix-helix protein